MTPSNHMDTESWAGVTIGVVCCSSTFMITCIVTDSLCHSCPHLTHTQMNALDKAEITEWSRSRRCIWQAGGIICISDHYSAAGDCVSGVCGIRGSGPF